MRSMRWIHRAICTLIMAAVVAVVIDMAAGVAEWVPAWLIPACLGFLAYMILDLLAYMDEEALREKLGYECAHCGNRCGPSEARPVCPKCIDGAMGKP